MIKRLIGRKLDRSEQALGESLDYVRHILRVSLPAFFRFAKIFSISDYRKKLPVDAYHIARIVAAREEDCGTCVQIEINIAQQAGVSTQVLQAVLANTPEHLPPDLALAYTFTETVVQQKPSEMELREEMRLRFGDEALVELALAIASSRFLPIVKRTLGYGTACSKVSLTLR